jgi:hypothetical protein
LNDLNEFFDPITVSAGEADELTRAFRELPLLRGSRDGDAASAAELEKAFVTELAQGSQNRVGVDAEDRGEIPGRREPLARFRFAVGDRPPDLGGGLFEQWQRASMIKLAIEHRAS